MKTILKSSILGSALAALLCSVAPSALAQATPGQSPAEHQINITNQVARIAARLQLTGQQQAQLLDSMQTFSSQRRLVFANTSLSQPEKRAKAEAVRETFITSVSAFLTPVQVKQLEKIMFEQHSRRSGQENPGTPGAPEPTPPQE